MKDLSLSLLSRGCGRFISSNRNTGRHDGRLDVCFTPQDYYIWKSQNSVLQLSNRGCLLVEAESTLPKTYSTRKGPLLLYSQDFITVETKCSLETRNRKQRVVKSHTQQVEQQLSTLKELTTAIMSYSNNQFSSTRLGPPFFPPLRLPLDRHHHSIPPIHTSQEQPSPELLVQLNPQWLSAERNTEQLEDQSEDKEWDMMKKVRLDLFLQIPCTSNSPTPQMEPQSWVHYVAVTPEEEPQTCLDMSQLHTDSTQQTEINDRIGGEPHHANMISVHDMEDDQSCSVQDSDESDRTSDKGNCEIPMSVNRHGQTGLLPPMKAERTKKTNRPRWEDPSSNMQHAQCLPRIAESCTVVSSRTIQVQTQRDAHPKAERVGCKSQENLSRLHQQPLFPSLLFPGKKENIIGNQRGCGEKTKRKYFKKETLRREGGGTLPSEKATMILLEPGEEPRPPVGVLGCVAGCKGPGKQSSFAFLQNRLLDLQDPSANRDVVRGILPLELSDLQNGKSVGSLILGPDGKIIQLSLYNNSQNPTQGDGDMQEQALQVLSAKGVKLPWIIILQPDHTHTEERVELHTNVPVRDIQHHHSTHKLFDLHRPTDTNVFSPRSHTDPVLEAVTKKKINSAEAVPETWKAPKKGTKTSGRMPPLREQVGKEEPSGDSTEAEEVEEEELGSGGQTSHLSGSHQPGNKLQFEDGVSWNTQNINPNEATTEDAVNKKRKNAKRKDAEGAAVTTRQRDMKTVTSAESDGQKTLSMRKERHWQRQNSGSDSQSTRSQIQEERTSREASEIQGQSAHASVKKKMNLEKEERGGMARRKEESTGRRRSRRLKHKELVVGNHEDPMEKTEMEINQEMEVESHLKSTKMPSATQRHNMKTEANSEEDTDTDHLSTNADKYNSVQSVSSLRSTAASQSNHWSLRRSAASSCEGLLRANTTGLASSHGRLSSCSTVMVTEEHLMLNPVKPESSRPRVNQEEEATASFLAQRAERRRQEVERKRREQEEEERMQQEKEQTEERMKSELEEERRKRAEELRLKRRAEEQERTKQEEEERERVRREQVPRERERRRQVERKRQMEQLQRMREEEERRRRAELEMLHLEEKKRQEEESKKLQEMGESERIEYLSRKEQEKEDRRNKEERRRTAEEAALQAAEEGRLQAELLTREMTLMQRQLAFKRGLVLEAGGLEKTQGISRPWIYSYFTLLQLLGLNPTKG